MVCVCDTMLLMAFASNHNNTFDLLYIIFMYATFLIKKKGKLLAIYLILIVINILVMSCKIFVYKCVCVCGGGGGGGCV